MTLPEGEACLTCRFDANSIATIRLTGGCVSLKRPGRWRILSKDRTISTRVTHPPLNSRIGGDTKYESNGFPYVA
jgi:hypothetical protein